MDHDRRKHGTNGQKIKQLWDPITTPLSVLSLIALAALAIYTARKRPLVSFCLLWFFLHLVIESSVIPLELIYEHRLYLPMLGFAVLVADLLSSGFAARRPWAWVAGALLVAALGTAAHARNEVWRDGVTLWSDVLAKNPGSHRAHYNLANELEARGRRGEAIRHYEEALRIRPRAAYIHVNLGIAIKRSGRPADAIRHYQAALGLEPDSAPAHNNLGVALDTLERLEEAVFHYSEALRIDPEYAKAHNNLAATLLRQGRTDEAIHHFSEALRIDPDYASARRNLGLVLGRSSAPTESDSRAQR